MKRSIRILLSAILISNIFTLSSSASMLGNFYITASGGVLEFTDSNKPLLTNIKNYDNYIGFLGLGYSLIKNFRFDGTIFLIKQKVAPKKFLPGIWGGLLTAYGSFKINSFFEIFAGPSIGFLHIGGEYADILNVMSKNTTSSKRNNLALGLSSGIGLTLFDTCAVDLYYRYINFGKTYTKDYKDLTIEDPIKAHMIILGIRKSL